MKKFVIERMLPGAGSLTAAELHHWIESFITDDKIYCIHIAESEEMVREHARRGNFPIHSVNEVKSMIDPLNSNPLE